MNYILTSIKGHGHSLPLPRPSSLLPARYHGIMKSHSSRSSFHHLSCTFQICFSNLPPFPSILDHEIPHQVKRRQTIVSSPPSNVTHNAPPAPQPSSSRPLSNSTSAPARITLRYFAQWWQGPITPWPANFHPIMWVFDLSLGSLHKSYRAV